MTKKAVRKVAKGRKLASARAPGTQHVETCRDDPKLSPVVRVLPWTQSTPETTRMIQFAQLIPDEKIVVTLSQQSSWSHICGFLPIRAPLTREDAVRRPTAAEKQQ